MEPVSSPCQCDSYNTPRCAWRMCTSPGAELTKGGSKNGLPTLEPPAGLGLQAFGVRDVHREGSVPGSLGGVAAILWVPPRMKGA